MNKCLEWSTSSGKSKAALDMMDDSKFNLIIVPKLCLIDNWKNEMKKWGFNDKYVDFSTYISIGKHTNIHYDSVVGDECFNGETEILTTKGFVKFCDLTDEHIVAQWEDNGNISFVKPIRIIKRWYNDDIIKVHLGRDRFCYMTPEHNQVYKDILTNKVSVKHIKDFKHWQNIKMPVCGFGTGNNNRLTAVERLFIAIQADGTLQRHQKNESTYSIELTKDRKKERILNILNEYGCDKFTRIKGKIGKDRYLIKLPKGDAKLLSTHFNINMGYERAKDFINEVVQWDGSIQGNSLYYSSKIKENSDFVAAIALQAGYKVLQSIEEDHRKETYSPIHRVFMRNENYVSVQPMKSNTRCKYVGNVYCVEVPSHKIVVKSQGYSFISGNCHHLSERARSYFEQVKTNNRIFLSATIPREIKEYLTNRYNCEFSKKTLKDQIACGRLPDPEVYLIPLELDTEVKQYPVTKNFKNKKITYYYTQQQFYSDLEKTVEWYKNKVMYEGKDNMKNMWMSKCLERNKWLSRFKEGYTKNILKFLKDKRVLTFCCDIKQTEELGKNCINSKNKQALQILQDFNDEKINQITTCNILAEGISLVNCEYTIFNYINSSDILQQQKNGRALRYYKPTIYIPYFKETREEGLVSKMTELYNAENITTLSYPELIYMLNN